MLQGIFYVNVFRRVINVKCILIFIFFARSMRIFLLSKDYKGVKFHGKGIDYDRTVGEGKNTPVRWTENFRPAHIRTDRLPHP